MTETIRTQTEALLERMRTEMARRKRAGTSTEREKCSTLPTQFTSSASSLTESSAPKMVPLRLMLSQDTEAQDQLLTMMEQAAAFLRAYGKRIEDVAYLCRAMVSMCGKYAAEDVLAAMRQWTSRKNQMPTPSDLINIIDPEKENSREAREEHASAMPSEKVKELPVAKQEARVAERMKLYMFEFSKSGIYLRAMRECWEDLLVPYIHDVAEVQAQFLEGVKPPRFWFGTHLFDSVDPTLDENEVLKIKRRFFAEQQGQSRQYGIKVEVPSELIQHWQSHRGKEAA